MHLTAPSCHCLPVEIKHHQISNRLEISFDDGNTFMLSAEYLRVYTQSAEAVGHGPGQESLQVGKEHVRILDIQPVGSYAVRLVFSDGHSTGLYTWDLLYLLGADQSSLWEKYLQSLVAVGYQRQA